MMISDKYNDIWHMCDDTWKYDDIWLKSRHLTNMMIFDEYDDIEQM